MRDVRILGGGVAGQVLRRELERCGVRVALEETAAFPRPKVCGGVLQADSWDYLDSNFSLPEPLFLPRIVHFWGKRRYASYEPERPMVFLDRFELDGSLAGANGPSGAVSKTALTVEACGVPKRRGEWIGFHAPTAPSGGGQELRMHYGNGAYLGVVSRGDRPGHGAFLVHRRFFAGLEALKRKFSSEFGVELAGEPKGSAAIDYSHYSPGLAVGDAKMATHPFLGFGMKHAILSARLLAELIARGSEASYPGLHAGLFRRIRLASLFGGRLYDSPFRRLLQLPTAFSGICYRWIHGGWSWPTGRRNTRMSGSV